MAHPRRAMPTIPFDIVGLDLDGTLLDTHRDLGNAVNHALTLGGFAPVATDRIEGLIGGGAKLMLRRALDEAGGVELDEFRRLYKALLGYYADHCAVHTRPYSGVVETLDTLRDAGVRLAVVTNKFESFARDILGQLDLLGRFDAVIGGDTLGTHRAKPAPDPVIEARARCGGGTFAFVGDSSYDVAAARAAGVPVVVAGYGYCDRAPADLGGDAVITRFDQLLETLRALRHS